MKKSFAWVLGLLMPGMAWAMGPLDFEAGSGYAEGNTVESHEGWKTSGGEIDTEQYAFGAQSLKVGIPAGGQGIATRKLLGGEWKGQPVAFVEFYILPGGSQDGAKSGAEVDIDGAKMRFRNAEAGKGKVEVAGADGKFTDSGYRYALEGEQGASGWLRMDLRVDYKNRNWDLLVGGKPVAVNTALPREGSAIPSEMTFKSSEDRSSATYVDNITLTEENPVFGDQDRDGMPDGEEVANGMSLNVNDRNGILGGDGVTNIEKFAKGAESDGESIIGGQRVIYVDNVKGSDSNSGAHSYGEGEGPKASLKAAMQVAPSESVIVVLKGSGVYEEGSRGIKGKKLTIKTAGAVTIK